MNNRKIAIPTDSPDGLASSRSAHFGHCNTFILVEINGNFIDNVTSLPNKAHDVGGCMAVVKHLEEHGVNMVITGGMGGGPFRGLQNAGIQVLFADSSAFPDVQSAINGLQEEKLLPMEMQQLCNGNSNCHQHQA